MSLNVSNKMFTSANWFRVVPIQPRDRARDWNKTASGFSKMAEDGSELIQTKKKVDCNGLWSLFFIDLEKVLRNYEQRKSSDDIGLKGKYPLRF